MHVAVRNKLDRHNRYTGSIMIFWDHHESGLGNGEAAIC